MIKQCSCIHTGQDSIHGKGNRVMNECKKGLAVRCTVCQKEYTVSIKQTKEKK